MVQFRWLHGIFLSLPCLFIHIYTYTYIYIYIFDKEEIVVPIPEKGIWRYGTDKKVVAMLKELMRASVSGMNIFLTLFSNLHLSHCLFILVFFFYFLSVIN